MDEIENDLISILLPIGSLRPWLADCLTSTNRASKNLNVELVIVMNKLEDTEQKVVTDLVEMIWEGDFETLIDNSDNLSDVLNTGIKGAKGKYIARIDDDDLMEPDRLSAQTRYFKKHPKTVLIGGSTKVIDGDGSQIRINNFPSLNMQIKEVIKYGNCFAHSTVMFSRDDAVRVGMYEREYLFAEDYHLWTKLAEIGEVHNIEVPIGSYRIHKSQVNQIIKAKQVLSVKEIIREIAYTDFQKDFKSCCYLSSEHEEIFRTKRNSIDLRVLSRQYFAVARLFADGTRRLNSRTIGYLVASFIINPIEFMSVIQTLVSIRSKRIVLGR